MAVLKINSRGLVKQWINQNLDEKTAVYELVQNSLDAGATVIDITLYDDVFSIKDNGKGMNKAELENCLSAAEHMSGDGKLGRYGIGLTHTVLRYGLEGVEIRSNNHRMGVKIDEEFFIKDHPVVNEDRINGTNITFYGHRFESYNSRIFNDMNLVFSGRLRQGLVINVNDKIFDKSTAVNIDNITENGFEQKEFVIDRKKVTIKIGRLANDINKSLARQLNGVTVFYDGVVIEKGTKSLKIFNETGVGNLTILVELEDGINRWQLSTNKNKFLENEALFSNDDVRTMVKQWITWDKEMSLSIAFKKLENVLKSFIIGKTTAVKEVREFKGKDMTRKGVEPKETGITRKPRKPNKAFGVDVTSEHAGEKANVIRQTFIDNQLKFWINKDHPYITDFEKNSESVKILVLTEAAIFVAENDKINKEKLEEICGGTDVTSIVSTLLEEKMSIDLNELING